MVKPILDLDIFLTYRIKYYKPKLLFGKVEQIQDVTLVDELNLHLDNRQIGQTFV
jgi:hypothetical protein